MLYAAQFAAWYWNIGEDAEGKEGGEQGDRKRKACGVLMGKPEGKRAAGRLKNGWTDSIKIDLKATGWQDVG